MVGDAHRISHSGVVGAEWRSASRCSGSQRGVQAPLRSAPTSTARSLALARRPPAMTGSRRGASSDPRMFRVRIGPNNPSSQTLSGRTLLRPRTVLFGFPAAAWTVSVAAAWPDRRERDGRWLRRRRTRPSRSVMMCGADKNGHTAASVGPDAPKDNHHGCLGRSRPPECDRR